MQIDDLLGRFAELSEEPDGGFSALCPSHPDTDPSLRIWIGENRKVRITCRVGCKPEDIIAAADLGWRDLFDVTGDVATVPAERPTMVDGVARGALAHYVARRSAEFESSSARGYAAARFGIDAATAADLSLGYSGPEAPDPFPYVHRAFSAYPRLTVPLMDFNGRPAGLQGRDLSGRCPGRWLSLTNPPGHRWATYGVMRGAGGYEAIIMTEGPGDGLTAVAVGYDAVVVRGAALVASPELMAELAAGLAGRQVIAAGDRDDAGKAFNKALADGLRPYGIHVCELRVPDHGPKSDLTDWREASPEAFASAFHDAVKVAKPARRSPEEVAAIVRAEADQTTGSETVTADDGQDASRVLAQYVDQYGDTDAGNAYALVGWTGDRIRYAEGLGYYVWNGKVWERSVKKVRNQIHRMAAALMLAGKGTAAKPFATTTRINDMLTELQSIPSVSVDAAAFDARHDLLTFRNGTVELRTGVLREHRASDMITYCVDMDYEPEAPAPRWEQFLQEIMPGMPEMPGYLQRLAGYGITGSATEQAFGVLWGKGSNGKSLLIDTLTAVFRAVTKTTPFATFEEKASGGIPNDIAALRGARLVMASEGESGRPMSEAVLKRVTGNEMISARFLRQEFFEFRPQFMLLLATNHRPKLRGQDHGLWRRVKLIPFKRRFEHAERDYDLDKKLLAEAAGIAAWAVRGAVDWYAGGLRDPEVITSATAEYRGTSDALAGFLPGVLRRTGDDTSTLGSDVYHAYRDWCDAEGLASKEVWSRRALYEALAERDINSKRAAKGVALIGVRLDSEEAAPPGPGIFAND